MDEISMDSQVFEPNAENEQTVVTARDIALMNGSSIVFKRWGGTIIDLIVITFFLVAFFFTSGTSESSIFYKVSAFLPLLSIVIFLGYYLIIESLTGYTLGKLILRIRVVDGDFNPPGLLKGLIRTVIRLIEINPFLFGGVPAGIIALISRTKQRLGDMAAGTYVLEVRDIPGDKRRLHLGSIKKAIVIVFIIITAACFAFNALCLVKTFENWSSGNFFNKEDTIYSRDQKYQLTLPNGWSEWKSMQKENDDSNLYAWNILNAMFFITVTENKSDFPEGTDVDIFVQAAKTNINNMFEDSRIISTVETNINGHKATQFEVEGSRENEKIYALLTYTETPEAYHQLIAWMSEKDAELNGKTKLQEITRGFKEKDKEVKVTN